MTNRETDTPRNRPAARLLVVSDNRDLSLHLRSVLSTLHSDRELLLDLRYTSANRDPQPMAAIGATEINVKDEATVQFILDTYDLVISLHCKQIFPERLVGGIRCINVHPGFNPYNRGWYPQVFSILNGFPIGATIHLMDACVDHGHIIAQQQVDIGPADTSLDVYNRVIAAEKQLISRYLAAIIDGTFRAMPPRSEGNYNSISDFNSLCALDLSSTGTLGEHIDLLRALTHGSFKNAFFVDNDGKKHYVAISITAE